MQASVESKATDKSYTLYVQNPGEPVFRDWKSKVPGDEPVVAVFDETYPNFDRIPHTEGDEGLLGYFICYVPLTEFEFLDQNKEGHYLLKTDLHAWEMDQDAMDQAMDHIQEWSAELGFDAPQMLA